MTSERGAWGPLLRQYRERAELSVKNLALAVDLAPGSLGAYETGMQRPSLERLKLLAQKCHCTPVETAELLLTLTGGLAVTPDHGTAPEPEPEPEPETVKEAPVEEVKPEREEPIVPAVAPRRKDSHGVKRQEVIRCDECGLAFHVLVDQMGESGYAITALTRAVRFLEGHIHHGQVTVYRTTWPKAKRLLEAK